MTQGDINMSVNFNNNNYNPSFGMAMRSPITEAAKKELIAFTKMNENPVVLRGYNQLKDEMAKLKRFDIEYKHRDEYGGLVNVIDNSSKDIVETFEGISRVTGLEHFGVVNYPGKKLFTALFNPKKHLPNNFLLAAERAKNLEAEAIKAEKLNKMI